MTKGIIMAAPSWVHSSHKMKKLAGGSNHWYCTKCKATTSEKSAATTLKTRCLR